MNQAGFSHAAAGDDDDDGDVASSLKKERCTASGGGGVGGRLQGVELERDDGGRGLVKELGPKEEVLLRPQHRRTDCVEERGVQPPLQQRHFHHIKGAERP